jgi:hypothetical protein
VWYGIHSPVYGVVARPLVVDLSQNPFPGDIEKGVEKVVGGVFEVTLPEAR